MYWTAVLTKPQSEDKALDHVLQQGFEAYLPKAEIRLPNRGRRVRPLFPRYLFVWIVDGWYVLRSTFGCCGPVMTGAEPSHMPTKIIEALRMREADGLVVLPFAFRVGMPVRVVKHGHLLTGQTVVFNGMRGRDRARILTQFLGSSREIDIEVDVLEAA